MSLPRTLFGLAAGAALLAGCRSEGAGGAGGKLSARWTGADSSSFEGPAVAGWCDTTQSFSVIAIRGDTALGVVIRSKTAPAPGEYAIRAPLPPGRPVIQPHGGLAVRWLGKTRVMGFRGMSGKVVLERTGSSVSGRFEGRLEPAAGDTTRLELTGRFRGVPVRPGPAGCSAGVD